MNKKLYPVYLRKGASMPTAKVSNSAALTELRAIEQEMKKVEMKKAKIFKTEIKSIINSMNQFGITLADLSADGGLNKASTTGKVKKGKAGKLKTAKEPNSRDKRSEVKAKYQNPATGASWSGRGKKPAWLLELINSGRDLNEFKV